MILMMIENAVCSMVILQTARIYSLALIYAFGRRSAVGAYAENVIGVQYKLRVSDFIPAGNGPGCHACMDIWCRPRFSHSFRNPLFRINFS